MEDVLVGKGSRCQQPYICPITEAADVHMRDTFELRHHFNHPSEMGRAITFVDHAYSDITGHILALRHYSTSNSLARKVAP